MFGNSLKVLDEPFYITLPQHYHSTFASSTKEGMFLITAE